MPVALDEFVGFLLAGALVLALLLAVLLRRRMQSLRKLKESLKD